MKAYIIECKPKGFFVPFSWLIRKFQGLPFSHYALVFINETGLMKTVDASGRTVHQESIENFKKRYEIIRTYKIENLQFGLPEFKRWLYPFEGDPYGYKQVVGLLFLSLGITKHNIFSNGIDKLICNEFVLRFLSFQGLIADIKFDDWDLVRTRKYLESHFKYEDGSLLLTTSL